MIVLNFEATNIDIFLIMEGKMTFFFVQIRYRCKSCARDSRREWRIIMVFNTAAEDSLREWRGVSGGRRFPTGMERCLFYI